MSGDDEFVQDCEAHAHSVGSFVHDLATGIGGIVGGVLKSPVAVAAGLFGGAAVGTEAQEELENGGWSNACHGADDAGHWVERTGSDLWAPAPDPQPSDDRQDLG